MSNTATAFLEYSDTEHKYYADGRELPSVTTVLDRAGLISPFCKDEEARARGSYVHKVCEQDDLNGPIDLRKVPVDVRGYLHAWRGFRAVSGFKPTLIEHRVDSLKYGYAGRFDRLGTRHNQTMLTLLDIKTSKTGAIPDYARLQLAAYALAFDPMRAFERMVVVLKPNGTYNLKIYPVRSHFIDRAEWLGILHQTKQENQ